MPLPKWMPSNWLIAQLAHVGWGALIVESLALHHHPYVGLAAASGWALGKEFIFDRLVEKQPFLDNLTDALFYGAGIGLGTVVVFL